MLKGLIGTDITKCQGCNKCVRVCPQSSANKVISTPEGFKITVNTDNCVACGECIKQCKHGARFYSDDTEAFLDSLKSGKSTSIIVAPAFLANYPELIPYLSPVGSPMQCAAVYLKKYDNFTGDIGAISPCIGKTDEFERNNTIKYNVTFPNIMKAYRESRYHGDSAKFDSPESLVGFWFPTPGGLKESVSKVFGKGLLYYG
jgi:iron only hydrogenase large subunit-like protein